VVAVVTAPVGRRTTLFEVAPSAMLNDGTSTIPAGELVSVTKAPPGGAALSREIVTSKVDPPTIFVGFTATETRLAAVAATGNRNKIEADRIPATRNRSISDWSFLIVGPFWDRS